MVWFGLVMAPILAVNLSAIIDNLPIRQKTVIISTRSGLINLGFLSLLLVLAVISLPWFRSLVPVRGDYRNLITRDTPTGMVKFLNESQPKGRVFNDMAFGSYMIWAAQPTYQVFADPRIELFPENVWNDYQVISRTAQGWEEKLEQYGVNTLVLNPVAQAALTEKAAASGEWQLVYKDHTAQVFQRVD